ncbi:MAG TPA: HAD family phosphatase [Enteractinococcus sp.]
MTRTCLKGVLWDMDGTIVDTEPYWFRAEAQLMSQWNVPWTEQDSMRLVGSALPVYAHVAQSAGVALSTREIIEQLLNSVISQTREAIPWRPGARELLAQLRQAGIPMGLVTMSEAGLANEIVSQLPADTFCVQVTGELVAQGKPAPDPYLLGARLLGEQAFVGETVDLRQIIAIEDSEPGVASALAAGLTTVGVPNIVALQPQPGLTLWPTLTGATIADLETLLAARQVESEALDSSNAMKLSL